MLASLRNIGHNKSDNLFRREANVSQHINIIGHYNNDTLIDKNGKLIQIIKLSGINGVTQSETTLYAYKNRRNSLFKNFSSEYAVYFWMVRRQTTEYPGGEFKPGFAQQLNDNYRKRIQQQPLFGESALGTSPCAALRTVHERLRSYSSHYLTGDPRPNLQ